MAPLKEHTHTHTKTEKEWSRDALHTRLSPQQQTSWWEVGGGHPPVDALELTAPGTQYTHPTPPTLLPLSKTLSSSSRATQLQP